MFQKNRGRSVRARALGAALAVAFVFAVVAPASAQDSAKPIQIPEQSLARSLSDLARQAGVEILAPSELVSGKQAPAVSGQLTASQALERLLNGSGLEARRAEGGGYVVRKPAPRSESETQLPEVSVVDSVQRDTAAMPGETPLPFAGGQVARGSQIGMLGNRDVMDTPFSSTSYTAQLIQNQQARTLADVMVNDPSVRNFYSQSFPEDSFYIRGFQVDSADFAMGGLYGVSPLMRTSPAAAERVEVLKGPSALLNGTPPFGGVGGTVNVVPKRAADQPITQITGSFASDSQFGTHVDLGRRFGVDNSIGLRFNGVYRDGDTALDENTQKLGEAVVGLDFRGNAVRLSLDLGFQEQSEKGIENGLFTNPGTVIPEVPDASRRIFQPWLNLQSRDTFGALRGELDLTDQVTVYAAAGGRRNELHELYAYGYPLESNGDFTEVVGHHGGYNNTSTYQTGIRGKFSIGSVKHDVNATVAILRQERGNSFVFGAPGGVDPITSNIYAPNFIAQPPVADLPGITPRESELKLTSFAVADALTMLSDKLIIIAGARSQRVKSTNYDTFTGDVSTSANDEKISPAAGIVFKPVTGVSLYANYIEGFSPAPAYAANANQLLAPALSKQVEAGVKAEFGTAGMSLSVFRIEQPNVVFDAGTARYTLDGMQRNRGIEFSVFGEPLKGVRMLGGVMLLDGKLTETDSHTYDGNTALNAPKLNLNAGVEWDVPAVPGFTITGRAIHTGKQFVDQANTQEIPAWSRFDVGARYALKAGGKPVTLRAAIENLADKAYWANSSLYRGAPRTYLFSATVDF